MRSDASPRVKGYEVFFGFREPPFSLAPDPRFLFDSASHAAAREQVGRALERREPHPPGEPPETFPSGV